MSLNKKAILRKVAKETCRYLRRNQTNPEIILWEALRNRKSDGKKFLRQHPIFHDISGKETFFIVDFYCHSGKLIIELDGQIHQKKRISDKTRDKILTIIGFKVLRFENEEIETNLDRVLEIISEIVDE